MFVINCLKNITEPTYNPLWGTFNPVLNVVPDLFSHHTENDLHQEFLVPLEICSLSTCSKSEHETCAGDLV